MPNAAGGLTEIEWQAQVTAAAKLMKWQFLHVRKSIGKGKKWQTTTNLVGWPDLFLWHSTHGFLAIELKVGKNQPTPDQLDVLASLARAGANTLVAYPSDWLAVERALKGQS